MAPSRSAGYTALHCREAEYIVSECRNAYSTAREFRPAGHTSVECNEACHSNSECRGAHYSAIECEEAIYTASQLPYAGYSAHEMETAGFTRMQCRADGHSSIEGRTVGFSAAESKAADCSVSAAAADFKAADCSVSKVQDVGLAVQNMPSELDTQISIPLVPRPMIFLDSDGKETRFGRCFIPSGAVHGSCSQSDGDESGQLSAVAYQEFTGSGIEFGTPGSTRDPEVPPWSQAASAIRVNVCLAVIL